MWHSHIRAVIVLAAGASVGSHFHAQLAVGGTALEPCMTAKQGRQPCSVELRPCGRDAACACARVCACVFAEVGCEKPNRCIFDAALDTLGVAAQDAVHVGDDRSVTHTHTHARARTKPPSLFPIHGPTHVRARLVSCARGREGTACAVGTGSRVLCLRCVGILCRRNDIWGARDAGVQAWLWGSDVTSFDQVAYRG